MNKLDIQIKENDEVKQLIKQEILKRLDFPSDIASYQIVSFNYEPTYIGEEPQTSIGIGYISGKNDFKQYHKLWMKYNKKTHHIFINKINEVLDLIYESEKSLRRKHNETINIY